jgi:hypothetical protein
MAIVGQGFGPAAELPLGALHNKSAKKKTNRLPRAGQKASGRAEVLPHDASEYPGWEILAGKNE